MAMYNNLNMQSSQSTLNDPSLSQTSNTNPNQLNYNSINPNAFDVNTTAKLFNSNNTDPLTGQFIDPTLTQGLSPGTINPIAGRNLV